MDEIARLMKLGESHFGSGGENTPAFKSFAAKFRNRLKKELKPVGAENLELKVGHFYVSGFFDIRKQTYWFSISDVRHFPRPVMLYRTAENHSDYTGGPNQYVGVGDGMAKRMRRANQWT